jgi:hypothetical protein
MKIILVILIIIAVLCSCTVQQSPLETKNSHIQTKATTTTVRVENTLTSYLSTAIDTSETETVILEEESDFIRSFIDRYIYPEYNDSVAFYDVDDDGANEVLRVYVSESVSNALSFTIYEVTEKEMKEMFVFTCLEKDNIYFENSLIGNKLCKYYDKEKDQFFWLYNILLIWDGDINVSYRIIRFNFDEEKLSAHILSETFGGWCFSADEPFSDSSSQWQERGRYIFLFGNSVLENQSTPIGFFDSLSKDKFNNDFENYISQYELVETIELDSLKRYYDKNEIYEKIKSIDVANNKVVEDVNVIYDPTIRNITDINITNAEDYNEIAETPHRYIIVTPENSNSDYFNFLYDDTEIECIRFVDCTQEQINDVLTNIPSLKCYFYGYSEV